MRYMTVTFYRRPGGQIDEQVGTSKRLKPADLQTCNMILDYKERKVEKCVVEGVRVDTDFDRMSEYYRKIYPVLVAQLEREWGGDHQSPPLPITDTGQVQGQSSGDAERPRPQTDTP